MKKAVSLVLSAAMAAALLTGCGGSSSSTPAGSAPASQGAGSAAGSTAEFVIGGMGPLTGAAASYGISVKQGAEVAVNEINAAGGVTVGGTTYTFKLVFEDDEATEDKAIQAYNTVMDQGANVILGAVTSGACMAIVDQTAKDGILQITPSGSAEGCIKNPNNFRICFSDPEQGTAMADYAYDTLGYKTVAVIYNNADDYSTGLRTAFEEEFAAKGGQVVASESFNTGDVDFNTQLTKIKAANPEVIYVPAYYQDISYIATQAKDMGMSVPFVGSDGWDGVLATVTDASAVEGAIFSAPFCAAVDDPDVVKFVDAYKTAYNATPDQFAADSYDGVYAFKAALEKAGSTDSQALIDAMTQISVAGLTGNPITFDASGAPTKDVRYVQIKDGAYGYAE